jgi:hypothetical protein
MAHAPAAASPHAKAPLIPGPDMEEGPHSRTCVCVIALALTWHTHSRIPYHLLVLNEEEFYDAMETGLDEIDAMFEEEEARREFSAQSEVRTFACRHAPLSTVVRACSVNAVLACNSCVHMIFCFFTSCTHTRTHTHTHTHT